MGLGYTIIFLPVGVRDSILGDTSLGKTNIGTFDFPAWENRFDGRESAIPKAHLATVFEVAGAMTKRSYLPAANAPQDGELDL